MFLTLYFIFFNLAKQFFFDFSPTVLEPFFLEANNFDLITQFLSALGIAKLFVYGNRPEDKKWKLKDLIMTSNLMNLKVISSYAVLYFYM